MNAEELKIILDRHKKWLEGDPDGKKANLCNAILCNANLRGANLRDADLRNADLCNAILCNANLRGANLRDADLRNADLRNADLCNAILCNANLCNANLCNANLYGADLCGANLRNAILCNAILCNANLYGANLYGADLCGANLCGANLRNANLCNAILCNANLCNANLYGAKNIPYIPLACPSDGEFTGWKVASNRLVELRIPADARRSSATTNKCRCDKAMVVGIYEMDGRKSELTKVVSDYNSYVVYRIGEMVFPDSYDENRWNEYSNGIHFFINKLDAIEYNN